MERTYDIFEVLPNGDVEWRECFEGQEPALARANDLASRSTNEFRVMHLATNSTVAVLNPKSPPAGSEGESPNPDEGEKGHGDPPARRRTLGRLRRSVRRYTTPPS